MLAGAPAHTPDHMRWQDILPANGWLVGFLAPHLRPLRQSAAEANIFQEQTTSSSEPWLLPFGINYFGRVI